MGYNSLVIKPLAACRGSGGGGDKGLDSGGIPCRVGAFGQAGLDDLEVSAWDETGKLVMGVRHPRLPVHGVQFHPDSAGSCGGSQLMRSFLGLTADGPLSGQ